jgi:hypothetical protein
MAWLVATIGSPPSLSNKLVHLLDKITVALAILTAVRVSAVLLVDGTPMAIPPPLPACDGGKTTLVVKKSLVKVGWCAKH